MRKQAYLYIDYPNIVVLQSYLDVVKEALESYGYECGYVKSLEGIDKKSLVVFPMGTDAFKFYFKGYHNFILWQQGATADESFMRNHSKLRYWVINQMDLFAMRKAKAILYVSEYMRKHYEEIGKRSFKGKSYLMPCFNEEFDETIYNRKDFSKKVFTYVGSLDLWQCFNQTVELYKKIEERVSGTHFKVLTFSVEEAERKLKEAGVKSYEVKCVPKEEVKGELESATYGFVIREDNIVNRVATPTKLSSYMAAGVIPIFSNCLTDFSAYSQWMNYAKKVEDLTPQTIDAIVDFVRKSIIQESIKKEYEKVFDSYYGRDFHRNQLKSLFEQTLK